MPNAPLREGDLATAAPDKLESVAAIVMAVLTGALFVVLAPFAATPLPRIEAFVPVYEAALSLCDLIAAVQLFAIFNRSKAFAVQVLGCAYLFNACMIAPHLLSFPGVFTAKGLLGGDAQTTAWLYCFWHGGFAVFVVAFAIARRMPRLKRMQASGMPMVFTIAATVGLAVALTVWSTAGVDWLPVVIEEGNYQLLVSKGISPAICAVCLLALILLYPRRREGVIDLWMLVVMTAWLCDVLLGAVIGSRRFDLGWYAGRTFGLVAAVVLLALLVIEFYRLDEKLESRTAQLRASEAIIQTFFRLSSECFAVLELGADERFRYEEINSATLELYGKTRAQVLGRSTDEVLGAESAVGVNASLLTALNSRTPQRYERAQADKVIEALATPLPDAAGARRRVIVSARDITERRNLEEQLRQSQKMDAVGQLTGGIAHDFNNMLAIVIGSLDIAQRRLRDGHTEDLAKWIENASGGAGRAAELTSRLLSFARRQPLNPKLVNLNDLVLNTSKLLRQTIPETIKINTLPTPEVCTAYVDPGQVENALVNLAINARDAMPEGGDLTIETANVELDERYAKMQAELSHGRYAMIAISDTGVGMAPEVVDRAFEPFFTTKEPGRGTGLGLSQVFGFAKQSKGHIKIYSELGRGTVVRLYLPRYALTDDDAEMTPPVNQIRAARGERVLVVEDEAAVRTMSLEALRELGYSVLSAETAVHALELLAQNEDIALLFTDVVMPDLNGRELAERARRLRPSLKVLYTTGYSRDAFAANSGLDSGEHMLSKPFSIDELAAKMEQVLTP